MKAAVHHGHGIAGIEYKDVPIGSPGYGEVKVRLKAMGLNHRDLFIMNQRNENDSPLIVGADGAGWIEEIGEGVADEYLNMEVIINPILDWEYTDQVPHAPQILGGPADGTMCEYLIIPAKNVVKKPAYLTWEESGVLPLAALTAYRALFTKGNFKPGERILIPGIGSGVATVALLMAKAAGAVVTVSSRSEEKLAAAKHYGADYTWNSHEDWTKTKPDGKVDLILDSIGTAMFPKYFDVLKPNGRIVNFGASSGEHIELPLRTLFFPQFSIIGTSVGSSEEFRAMIHFIEKHSIRPVIDKVYPLSEAGEAYRRMKDAEQFGKIAIINE